MKADKTEIREAVLGALLERRPTIEEAEQILEDVKGILRNARLHDHNSTIVAEL